MIRFIFTIKQIVTGSRVIIRFFDRNGLMRCCNGWNNLTVGGSNPNGRELYSGGLAHLKLGKVHS